MAYQLIFTSYPTSLTVGRSGFSTVARSADMSEKLASMVERLGVYEPDTFKAKAFSHKILSFGGKEWHILTRICPAKADYTGRSNYLAHHLAIDSSELKSLTNPADILFGWGGWVSEWTGEPRLIGDASDLQKVPSLTILPARHWAELTGDAGSASLIGKAQCSIVADTTRPDKLLKLFSESMRLFVNPLEAWEITFTTSLFRGENASDYVWRVLPVSSAEAGLARINIANKFFPTVPEGRAATYARTGEMNNREKLGLKVGVPVDAGAIKFKIEREAEPEGFKTPPMPAVVIGSMAALVLVCVVIIYFLYFDMPKQEEEVPLPEMKRVVVKGAARAGTLGASGNEVLTSQKSDSAALENITDIGESNASETVEGSSEPKQFASMDAVRADISGKLDSRNFVEAVHTWRDSGFANNDPLYERRLLSRIGARIDGVMDDVERSLNDVYLTNEDRAKLKAEMESVARALREIDVPRSAQRNFRANVLTEKLLK